MSIRNLTVGAVSLFGLVFLVWLGCSTNNSGSSVGPLNQQSASDIVLYFPLNQGYSTTYEIRSSDGSIETVNFKVGKEVTFLGRPVVEWLSYDKQGIDTTYFEVTETALYYYTSSRYPCEKILELPLEPGHSWSRYSQGQTYGDSTNGGFTDIITDYRYKDNNGDTTTITPPLGKTFPTIGSGEMTVEQIERLEMSSGALYSDAVLISNGGTLGKKNYYWFVPGIGLVKYVIGATPDSYPEGDIVGELVLYGY